MTLRDGQLARLLVVDVETGAERMVAESAVLHIEAPNWTPDGRWLVVNAEGGLWRLPAPDAEDPDPDLPEPAVDFQAVDLGGVPPINNDHVISPDGEHVYVSGRDGHLYDIPWNGGAGGAGRRITADRDPALRFKNYLHGVSPDGTTLSVIGGQVDARGEWTTNIHLVPVDGGPTTQLTDDGFPDDGAEFSPDGGWLYYNSERGSDMPGHAQLFTMRVDGTDVHQFTSDERVNWFPHPSPDGEHIVYVSFPPGTLGHPADRDVILRVIDRQSHRTRDLAAFPGGQGTINVTSWAPDSRRFAYVAYPFSAPSLT
ncbi:TolB family protein [Clavibacter sp. Sh2141]|uniref:TolB family protein n=1 Tax=Clavibacter sp. Sh2141 TaxID=3395374 RepID=UPI0039BD20D7